MARLKPPAPAVITGGTPPALTRPLDPAWRDGGTVAAGIRRWAEAVTEYATTHGILDQGHPDWQRLAEQGITRPTNLDRCRARAEAGETIGVR